MNNQRLFSSLTAFIVACGLVPAAAEADGVLRQYYISAEEVDWDFAPLGRDEMMGMEFSDDQNVFVETSDTRIGSVYRMAQYIGYENAEFTVPLTHADPSTGILGPVIHAEVGDQIEIVFRNNTRVPTSIHPHGVFYDKASEGAMTNDGTGMEDMMDAHVQPGATYTYHWDVPERAGPGPNDESSVVWLYHSHADEVADTNSGLVGPMVITAAGKANPDGSPMDVDQEVFSYFSVMNQNESLFFDQMLTSLAKMPDLNDEFEESNLMHAINGYVFGNMPMPVLTEGTKVRWYMMSLGTEVDLHTPHWHGNTVLHEGHRKDVVELLPATTLVVDMWPDNPGIWMYHCHVNDHIAAGMTGRFEVAPAG